MIPDHLILRAAQAALAKGVYGEPDSDDLLDDMHPADLAATLDATRAALEAVAADLWDEGHRTRVQRGPDGCTCNAWNEDECACGEYGTGPIVTPNPYRASETA